MGDYTELYKKAKKISQEKRRSNVKSSIYLLKSRGIEFETLDELTNHYRIGYWNFWPSTGKFYNYVTKEKGRGVFNLIKIIKHENKQEKMWSMWKVKKY